MLVVLCGLLVNGCFGTQGKKHYYRVYYRPNPAPVSQITATARIRTLEIDKVYRRYNLVYRASPYELSYYTNHYWASRPSDMMTDLLYYHIKAANLFSDLIIKLDKTPDYEIGGEVLEIDRFDDNGRSYAHLSMVLTLKDFKTGKVIVSHTINDRREVAAPDPLLVVRAIGEITEKEIEVFIQKIAAEIEKQ
ncbi:MAG TPA: ABC-type transport auxiliary lipoprotein family protein [bacterium]|nr:ABC-type transport auxiliary lipoprotein family protein [bacterium]